MSSKPTKPFLAWIKNGDPDLVPIVMADARSTAASYLDVPVRTEGVSQSFSVSVDSPVTPEMVRQCVRETGIQFAWSLGSVSPLNVLGFVDDIDVSVEETVDDDGVINMLTTIRTPAGDMSDLFVTPPSQPACWREHLVKSDRDLPAFAYVIESAARVVQEDPRIRPWAVERFRSQAEPWPPETVLRVSLGVPTFSLTCGLYVGPEQAFALLFDHRAEMERLFEAQAQFDEVVIDCAAEAGADIALGAINGLELYSPAIYRDWFVPQAAALHAKVRAAGMLGWVHTCGFMRELIEMGVYDEMNVDVLESLTPPPTGDLVDLKAGRARLSDEIVTRGAVGVDQFYSDDVAGLRQRVRDVLDATRGHRHMIGDTNDSFPPYPRDNILAVVDEVRKSGRYFE